MDYVYIDRLHIKYSDSPKHEYSGYVADGSPWNPKEDLNCWPAIYKNMNDHEEATYMILLALEAPDPDDGKIKSDLFIHNCPAETRYKALVEMLKENPPFTKERV